MSTKPTYEELEQRVQELEKEAVERKQAKVALGKNEQKNGTLFIGSVSAVAVKDGNDQVKYHDGVIESPSESGPRK